jgi:hypothetical protein
MLGDFAYHQRCKDDVGIADSFFLPRHYTGRNARQGNGRRKRRKEWWGKQRLGRFGVFGRRSVSYDACTTESSRIRCASTSTF